MKLKDFEILLGTLADLKFPVKNMTFKDLETAFIIIESRKLEGEII